MENRSNIDNIVSAFIRGDLSKAERETFLKLVKQTRNVENLSEIHHNIFSQIESLPQEDLLVLDTLLKQEAIQEKKNLVVRFRPLLRYVAVLMLCFGVYALYQYQLGGEQGENNIKGSIEYAHSDNAHILPDGSEILLDENSTLRVLEFNDSVRNVLLVGKATFTVVPAKTTFSVYTEAGYFTRVLGTKFTVDSRTTDLAVAVERGKVSVGKDSEVYGVLFKGDSMQIENTSPVLYSDVANPLVFENIRLGQVLTTVNQVYDAQIKLSSHIDPDILCQVTFEKDLSTIEIVEALCEIYGYTYSIKNSQITIQ